MIYRLWTVVAVATLLATHLPAQWQLLARKDGADVGRFFQSSSGTLFAQLSSQTKIFRSFDGGITWSPVELPPLQGIIHFAPCTDSLGLEALVVVTGGAFYRSTDNGLSWQQIPPPSGITSGESILSIEGLRYGELIILTETAGGNAVYVSRDRAESVMRIGDIPSAPWRFAQLHDSAIYCYGSAGLYRINWRMQTIARVATEHVTALVSNQEYSGAPVIYWAIRNQTVVRSTDGGTSWTDAHAGLSMLSSSALLLPAREGTMFCFNPLGDSTIVYRRFASSTQWALLTRQGFAATDAIATLSGALMVATSGGVFRSEESGMFWSNSSSGIQGISIICASYVPSVALVAASQRGELFRSVNAGLSWTTIAKLPAGTTPTDLWVSPNGLVLVGTTNGAWCSTDGGATIRQCSTATGAISDTIVSVGTFKGTGVAAARSRAYVSLNGGLLWLELGLPMIGSNQIISFRSNDSLAIVATTSSVIAIESVAQQPVYRTIATFGQPIVGCDIAADGSIGVITDSSATLVYHRYRTDGQLEARVVLPTGTLHSIALSRGGFAHIAADAALALYTIGRRDTDYRTDTSIAELVLYLRRQSSGEMIATTSDGGIYRAAADSILSVERARTDIVTLWPNPTAEELHIEAGTSAIWGVHICDGLGRSVLILSMAIPQQSLHLKLPTIAPGYYIAAVRTAKSVIVRPLVIIR